MKIRPTRTAVSTIFGLAVALALVPLTWVGGALSAGASTTQMVTVSPTADAYVSQASPSTNFGSASLLTVASSPADRSYLLFNVSGLTGTVTSAQLVLHAATSGSSVGLHQASSNAWSESSVTYANAPAFGARLSLAGSFAAGATVNISANAVVTGNGTFTIVLTSTSTTPISFSSREAGASVAPQLVITEAVPTPTPTAGGNPIRHIVVFFQENHSFDNVLGELCAANTRAMACDGATTGKLPNGSTITLSQAPDIVPDGQYGPTGQQTAIDGGKMDGFGNNFLCRTNSCYSAYFPSQIPNLAALATKFTISDRSFELSPVPSWSGHMELAAATLDGFVGFTPFYNTNQSPPPPPKGPGWGCNSNNDASWTAPGSTVPTNQPACVPDPALAPTLYPHGGAYRTTPVQHVDTIMDRLDGAGLSWKLYTNNVIWSICPTFADCYDTAQKANMVPPNQFVTDAQKGALPSFSVLLPSGGVNGSTSQHNGVSMANGDNWIGQAISAVENGPDWSSTAIFITYDDMGGFYDHVPPPFAGAGIRVPMVIVSPYAKPGFTDSTAATFASMLAYTEHTFSLSPLGTADGSAYDYANAFNYSQTPLSGAAMASHPISAAEQRYLAAHPPNPNDPS